MSHPVTKTLATLALLGLAGALPADTVTARCDIYPLGSDHTDNYGPCTFSQRQGHIVIELEDGSVYDFTPDASEPNLYRDANGGKVVREEDSGSKDLLIFRTVKDSVYVYWNPAIGTPEASQSGGFAKTLEMQGFGFHVEATHEGSLNQLTIVPLGIEQDDVIEKQIDGAVSGAEIADLDGNGFPEIYVYVTSAGSGSYGSLEAHAVNRGISVTPIFLPEMGEKERQGYMGHDKFRIVENRLVRSFPVYRDDDSNANPTGETRRLEYRLKAGEADWVLELVKVGSD